MSGSRTPKTRAHTDARALAWSARQPALGEIDVALARTLDRVWPGADATALRAAATASWAVQQGHGCLDLDRIRADRELRGLLEADERIGAIEPDAWLSALAAAPFARDGDPVAPLVVEGRRIYLRRYHRYEQAVSDALRRRAPSNAQAVAASGDPQADAIARALTAPLTVVCGGPGTGKTWTIAQLVAALRERDPSVRIGLAAPTGKAAARLSAALHDALPGADGLPQAVTLHRLLGFGGGDRGPRHGASHPLPLDVLVVDEASMVDLALFAKLLAALRDDARLVLVGDPGQLPAVEGGAVLGALAGLAATAAPLGRCVVTLERARRFETDGAIEPLTRAIAAGDAAATCAALRVPGVAWHDAPYATTRGAFDALVRDSLAAAITARDPVESLEIHARFRVLCALRAGPHGVAGLNAASEAALGVARGDRERYDGRPLLVVENDAARGFHNGDFGVVAHDAEGRTEVHVRDPRGAMRRLPLTQLPAHETAYAMTAHKAQGSEFDAVAIVLPPDPHPLVTREWLYTAVSRARSAVHLFAPRAAVEAALERRLCVMSGLGERLAAR